MGRKSYQSDLSDAEWEILEKFMPPPTACGRPRKYSWRDITNAIFYILKAGCQWRMLPHDMPPWWTVYHYFRKWKNSGFWEQINDQLREATRVIVENKNDRASAGVIDSQSVKTTEAGGLRGYDAGKNVNGRKRHIVVDTNGLLLSATVHEANIQDRDGAVRVLKKVAEKYPDLKLIWADGGYAGRLVQWANKKMPFKLEITKRPDDAKGFVVVRRRWVVERTFGWLGRDRRHSKDYERQPTTGEALINASMSRLMLRRLTAGA